MTKELETLKKELAKLDEKVAKERKALEDQIAKEEGKLDAKKQLDELAASLGYTIQELYGPAKAEGKKSSGTKSNRTYSPPMYQNPDQPKSTWNGKGKTPQWLADLEAAGRDREEFRYVKKT